MNRTVKKNKPYVLLFFFFVLVILCAVSICKKSASDIISPLAEVIENLSQEIPNGPSEKNESLAQIVQDSLKNTTGDFGIVIKNLKTGEQYAYHEHDVFESASLYKLWVMATAYDQIRNTMYKENTVISQEIPVLNEKFNISSDAAEQTEGSITLSVYDTLSRMITVSDNYAALLLSEKVRLSNMASFLESNNFLESKIGTNTELPTVTAYDAAVFFERLYEGTLVNKEYSKEMLDLLKQQKLNNKIPLYLPETLKIAHKTGELGTVTHDVGIVYTDKGDILIAVLSDSNFPSSAEETIGDLSKRVVEYFIQ